MLSYIEYVITTFDKTYPKRKGNRSQKYFRGKQGLQETGTGESNEVPKSSGKYFVCY